MIVAFALTALAVLAGALSASADPTHPALSAPASVRPEKPLTTGHAEEMPNMPNTTTSRDNKKTVTTALDELFNQHDVTAVDRYWRDPYIQHNPTMPNGLQTLRDLVAAVPDIRYEIHAVLADGDLVAVHGRVTGWGPKPVIVEDIFRLDRGRIVEHWDVVQDETPASETVSGNPMI